MPYKKYKKRVIAPWKVVRRCVVFFTTICIIPVILVLLVTTDQYMRPIRTNRGSFMRPEMDPHIENTQDASAWSNTSHVEERLDQRRRQLKTACRNLGLNIPGNDSLHKANSWEFLVNRKHHLVWCNVFKAASTSWMYNFNLLAGYSPKYLANEKLVPLNLARKRYPRPSLNELREAINDSLSLIIVRHPFERLLSAYRDKLQFSLPNTYHRKMGNEIIAKYRTEANRKKLRKQKWPLFSEFVSYLLDCVKRGDALDMHWTPITDFCTPCMFHFDVIAHTETFQEDQEYVILKAGLQDIIKPQWKNPGRGTSNQIETYFSELTRAQILQLYHIYRYDFELFNYSMDGYFEIGKPDDDPSQLLAAITMKELPRPIRLRYAFPPIMEDEIKGLLDLGLN